MIRSSYLACLAVAMLAACGRAPPAPPRRPATGAVRIGVASFYDRKFNGRKTASGERLRPDAMTAASRTLPIGAKVRVVDLATGKSAQVRINDRGPYVGGRVLDLTPRAARSIGLSSRNGVAPVAVKPAGRPTPAM